MERGREVSGLDLLVVAKLKLLPPETSWARRKARRIVYDFDDAVYVGKPERPGLPPNRSRWRLAKFAATCRMADLVVAGNEELARFARPFARRAEVVPTGIDVSRYPAGLPPRSGGPVIAWIGLPENLSYLELIRPALAAVAGRVPGLRLRVISSRFPEWPEIPVERVAWSEGSEVAALSTADVGVMPLSDDDWARGKGGFKLLQYMAAGLPCVASPVGANHGIVVDGVTGLLPADGAAWFEALRTLLSSAETRRAMGREGRRRVETLYDRRVLGPRVAALYESLLREDAGSP